MRKYVFVITALCLICLEVFCQPSSYLRQLALGLMLSFHDFKGGRDVGKFGRSMKPGLVLYFQNDLSKRLAYNISFDGSCLDFPAEDGHSLGNGKDQLLTEGSFNVHFKLTAYSHLLSPWLHAGAWRVRKYKAINAQKEYWNTFNRRGIAPKRLSSFGCGQERPVARNFSNY